MRDVAKSVPGALMIGVDRLDYSKGLSLRLEAYERFLAAHPERHGKITYLQITPKSRSQIKEYAEMAQAVNAMAGRINGAYSNAAWAPVRYVNRAYSRTALAGLYRTAKVGLVTPLRDGMNLVAKEYVAAQDAADPGVLILSRFAGAAEEFKEGALVWSIPMTRIPGGRRHDAGHGHAAGRTQVTPCIALCGPGLANDISKWGDRFLSTLDGDQEFRY